LDASDALALALPLPEELFVSPLLELLPHPKSMDAARIADSETANVFLFISFPPLEKFVFVIIYFYTFSYLFSRRFLI
jgi:hypothetical protein